MPFSPLVSALLSEFIGTFLIAVPVPLASAAVGKLAAMAVGFMVASMVFSCRFISGAQFNPTMSFALWISSRMQTRRFLLEVAAQFLGAWLSSLYTGFLIGVDVPGPETFNLFKAWKSIAIEIALTFAFISVALHTTVSRQGENGYYGFASGFVMIGAILCIPDGFNGSAFNPAIATALQITKCIQRTDYCTHLAALWIHWLAPFTGALIAVLAYGVLDTEEKKEDTQQQQ